MICEKPFMKGGAAFGCGQCRPCRYNRRRLWTHRLMLESLCHKSSVFITLTYDHLHLPMLETRYGPKEVLDPYGAQLWVKRLRHSFAEFRLRYYLVGEYGEVSERPHYHAIVFGLPACARGRTYRMGASLRPAWSECCDTCRKVGKTWGAGHVDLGEVNRDSCQYLAGYVVKKMTAPDDHRLEGRVPEFARMSLRPGIGAPSMWDVASTMMKFGVGGSPDVDVPASLNTGRASYPLGRYLRRKLRVYTGLDENAPVAEQLARSAELLPLQKAAIVEGKSFSEKYKEVMDGQWVNQRARLELWKKRKWQL